MSQAFADLGLSPLALAAITKKGFEEPTEIQKKAIPILLTEKRDVVAQAQTGTGKTATFGLVFTDKISAGKSRSPQAIVLAPTRELAVQISEELNSLKGENRLSIVPIYGGQSWGMQRKHLSAGVDIVVGTPGRVMDHLEKGTLKLDKVEYFVLDEADEMLNMGFIEDIETILEQVNPDRQVLLFSATMPSRIASLAKKYMNDPFTIKTKADEVTNASVDQIYFEVSFRDKFEALCRIIDMEEEFYGIVFCRTKVDSDNVSKHLNDRGYRAEAFHGDISQDRRESILRNFKKRKTEILVATDVAARGIDVNDLTHVINYSLPQNSESYVHRIGRTGRAGKEGKAITLITPAEYRKLRMYEHRAQADITKQSLPTGQAMVDLKKQKIVRDLGLVIDSGENLKKYETMASEMFAEHDTNTVIAALLKYSFSEQLDVGSYKSIQEGNSRGKPRMDDRGGRSSEEFGQTRLFLAMGWDDGANPPKILRMIEQDFGFPSRSVGDIDITNKGSFISVPLGAAEKILDAYHKLQKNGRASVLVEKASREKHGADFDRKKKRGNFGRGGGNGGGRRGGFGGGKGKRDHGRGRR